MMQRMKGTLRPGRKAGVLALAVLLLTCVLMAGAVSASDEVTSVSDISALKEALEGGQANIALEGDIVTNEEIVVERAVTIDGNGHTISAGADIGDHLLEIIKGPVTLKNLTLDSDGKAKGLNIHEPGPEITLTNLTLTKSAGSGITINGADVFASNLTISKSAWNQSIDVGISADPSVDESTLTLTGTNDLQDPYQINSDNPGSVTVHGVDGYTTYDWYYWYMDGNTPKDYGNYKRTWTTNPNFATAVDIPKVQGSKAAVCVSNTEPNVYALHQDIGNATTFFETGDFVTQLQDIDVDAPITINKAITFDGSGKTLTLSGTAGYQGVITVENGATLQNLNVVAEAGAAFGTAIKVVNGNLIDSTIDLTNQNAESSSATGRMSAIAVYVVSGEISDNTIQAGNSKTSSSQCVVVNGDGVTVSGNTLTTGQSAAKTEEGKRTSGSVGIRLSGVSTATTITNNHITSTKGAGLNNGIAADGVVKTDVTIEASGNTFVLATTNGGGAFYVNPQTDGTTVTLDAKENTVESAASFIYADDAEEATAYTINGTIENNDFAAADKGLVSADKLALTLDENFQQSGNSGLITDPSESLDVDTVASKITVTGAEVSRDGDNNATIKFTGYKILITNATVSDSGITYNGDSTAIVTHDRVRHMGSPTDIDVELLITDMSKLAEISTPKATIGDAEKARLAEQKITPVSVVDIHHEGEPGFDQITLTISGLAPSGEIIGFHVGASSVDTSEVTTQDGKHIVTFTDLTSASPFGIGVISDEPQPVYSSGGNMNNAYRVLFNDGSTTLTVQTDLSSGDKLTKPETPVKDGYTFAGWYKDSACTQAWDFETGIPGDMTLYAKWTAAGSSGETEATATPTATATAVTTPQPTKTQTAAATTSAPEATTAAGVSPTLTQAPAPVAGALFGLLAAGVLLRRRFQ